MVKIRIQLDKAFLALFFAVFLLAFGGLLGYKIKHEFPYAYFASDPFQHQVRAEAIKEAGNFKYEAIYISKGIADVEGRYPPVLYHLAVILSYAAGLETYDAIYFIVIFFIIIASFMMYFIIKNFNSTIALMSLPLSLLVLSSPISIGLIWGHWPSLLAQSFLMLFFWGIAKLDLEKSFLLIALSLAAVGLAHTSELVFALLFLALFFILKILMKKFSISEIKKIATAFAIFFVVSFYYLVIFLNTWAKSETYSFKVEPIWQGNPGFYILGFGLLLVPIFIGIVLSLKRLKDLHIALILAFAMLVGSYLNYIGFGLRSFQLRFFWPIYLAVFFGYGAYAISGQLIKKWNFAAHGIFIVLVILLLGVVRFPIIKQTGTTLIPLIPQLSRSPGQGLMDAFHWEALSWISKNTEKDAVVYFFYGDIYSQDALLRNSKRVHQQVDPEDFIKALQQGEIRQEYLSEFPGDTGGRMAVRTSFFKFESADKSKPEDFHFGTRDICNFDYFVFDKVSRQEVLAKYNLFIAQELLKKDYIKPVFDNKAVVILKNNNPGDDCIEERKF